MVVVVVAVGADASHDLHPLRSIALVHGPELVSAASHAVSPDSLQFHANIQALLETTVGTPFPLRLVNVTTPVGHTRVDLLVLNRPLEETLATFASQQAVVVAAGGENRKLCNRRCSYEIVSTLIIAVGIKNLH